MKDNNRDINIDEREENYLREQNDNTSSEIMRQMFAVGVIFAIIFIVMFPLFPTTEIHVVTDSYGKVYNAWIQDVRQPIISKILKKESASGYYSIEVRITSIDEKDEEHPIFGEYKRLEKISGDTSFEWTNKPDSGTFKLYITIHKGGTEIDSIVFSFQIMNGELSGLQRKD